MHSIAFKHVNKYKLNQFYVFYISDPNSLHQNQPLPSKTGGGGFWDNSVVHLFSEIHIPFEGSVCESFVQTLNSKH